jgi:hypothetical protein
MNGAKGLSDIEGKVTRVGASESGQRELSKPARARNDQHQEGNHPEQIENAQTNCEYDAQDYPSGEKRDRDHAKNPVHLFEYRMRGDADFSFLRLAEIFRLTTNGHERTPIKTRVGSCSPRRSPRSRGEAPSQPTVRILLVV